LFPHILKSFLLSIVNANIAEHTIMLFSDDYDFSKSLQ
jgi:hypothetical protein